MLTHADIWNGIDALARRNALSPSGLARIAGLDPTTFNRSKRFSNQGEKPRWPSTESIAKVLEATGVAFEDFAAMAAGQARATRRAPLLGFARAGEGGFFDEAGLPIEDKWDAIDFPGGTGEGLYALEVTGDSMEPVYRAGDRIIVAPRQEVRAGDRIVVRTHSGEVMAKELGRLTATTLELVSLNPAYPMRALALQEVSWIARILWASQ